MKKQASKVVETSCVVKGVKGPSLLCTLPKFHLASRFCIDYMHCILLGVVRTLMMSWFDTKHRRKPWYVTPNLKVLQTRLLNVKSPSFVTRTPRLFKGRAYWKASEYRSWLLFYSPPVLSNILPDAQYQHFILLVGAVYLLLRDSIERRELDLSEMLLGAFVEQVRSLYGK